MDDRFPDLGTKCKNVRKMLRRSSDSFDGGSPPGYLQLNHALPIKQSFRFYVVRRCHRRYLHCNSELGIRMCRRTYKLRNRWHMLTPISPSADRKCQTPECGIKIGPGLLHWSPQLRNWHWWFLKDKQPKRPLRSLLIAWAKVLIEHLYPFSWRLVTRTSVFSLYSSA